MMDQASRDWQWTLEDRQHRREQWTIRLGIVAALVAFLVIMAVVTYTTVKPNPDPRCPGILEVRPGQTVTITCPPVGAR